MQDFKPLTSLNVGEKGKIKELCISNTHVLRRIRDMGLINGTVVECVLKSPSSNPIAYKVRGAVIALRNEDSDKISIY